jgi:hypothetical protein
MKQEADSRLTTPDTRHPVRIFRLPAVAGAAALTLLADLLLRQSQHAVIVFDFTSTIHIDFRALRTFAARARSCEVLSGPIWLSGLSPYCEEVFRFALSTADWDLFVQMPESVRLPRGNRGNGTPRRRQGQQKRVGMRSGRLGNLLALQCPN